jgi:hypothetical protein
MAHTITDGVTTITIPTIDGYSAPTPTNNLVRAVIGTSEPSVSFRAASLRAGTLSCVFDDEGDAWDLYALLLAGVVLTLASTARPVVDMDFVATGNVTPELDSTRAAWLVSFDWQEV